MMFLELAVVPIKYYIMQRCMNYYHYLLNQHHDSLLSRCFQAQVENPIPGDFVLHVEKDLAMLGISMSIDQIKSLSRNKFKEYVNLKIRDLAFRNLIEEKNRLSISPNVHYNKFNIQNYLLNENLSIGLKKMLCYH